MTSRYGVHFSPMDRLLRTSEVCELVGLSRQEIWRRRGSGSFPEPVKIGGRRVAYSAAEVQKWLAARVAERDERLAARKAAIR